MRNILRVLFLSLVVAALLQVWWQHDRLPARVATHFNAAGQPNGWMTRDGQTTWQAGMLLLIAGLLEGLARLSRRLPVQYVNLPHRDYWFAPERRAATQAWLADLPRRLGCALMGFFLVLFHLVYRANLDGAPLATASVGLLTAGMMLVVALVLLGALARFARPPA